MRKFNISTLAIAIWILLCVSVMAKSMTVDDYQLHKHEIASEYRTANTRCISLTGAAKNRCVSDAFVKNKLTKSELDTQYNTSDRK